MKKKKRDLKKILTFSLVAAVAIILIAVSATQLVRIRQKNEELEARKARLEELIAEELDRTEALEEEAVYVQTQKYIEEKARSIGYVYEDEIIIRREED